MNRRLVAVLLGLVVPFALCAALYPARSSVPNTDDALALVVVVVAVATFGVRLAGLVAALSAGVSFDLLLTVPYGSLSIHSRQDVETVLLLVIVGVAVTEIAAQGWRQRGRAAVRARYLDDLRQAVTAPGPPTETIDRVSGLLVDVLGLASCRFEPGPGPAAPELTADGTVRWGEALWDVAAEGLPLQTETALPVSRDDVRYGRFLLTSQLGSRPDRTELLVAVLLADQVAATLAVHRVG